MHQSFCRIVITQVQLVTVIMSYLSMTFFILALVVVSNNRVTASEDFCYQGEECGPSSPRWGGECQSGSHQSPIDLSTPAVRKDRATKKVPLHFNTPGYSSTSASSGYWIRNNGHTIQVSLGQDPTSEGRMWGYGMPSKGYIFAQIHFHWGDDENGSEHTVAGRHLPIEVHLVHYDAKYGSFDEAAHSGDPKGLAVLGVFLAAGTESDENEAFDTITSRLPLHYQESVEHIPGSSLDLRSLLPVDGAKFYRYIGSLTTPNCTEAVEWTVIEEPIKVRPSEIEKFHGVLDHVGIPMGINYRPVQPLGDRVVEYLAVGGGAEENYDVDDTSGGESGMKSSLLNILTILFLLGSQKMLN